MKQRALISVCCYGALALELVFAQEKVTRQSHFRDKVEKELRVNLAKCIYTDVAVSEFGDKKEFWSVCSLKNGNRIIKIQSHKKTTYFKEIYFEKKGKLRYAQEKEDYMPVDSFSQVHWGVEYFFKDGKMVDFFSIGHGKTEDPNWDIDISNTYKKRLKQIKIMENAK